MYEARALRPDFRTHKSHRKTILKSALRFSRVRVKVRVRVVGVCLIVSLQRQRYISTVAMSPLVWPASRFQPYKSFLKALGWLGVS